MQDDVDKQIDAVLGYYQGTRNLQELEQKRQEAKAELLRIVNEARIRGRMSEVAYSVRVLESSPEYAARRIDELGATLSTTTTKASKQCGYEGFSGVMVCKLNKGHSGQHSTLDEVATTTKEGEAE